jgi:hypothetical protein
MINGIRMSPAILPIAGKAKETKIRVTKTIGEEMIRHEVTH